MADPNNPADLPASWLPRPPEPASAPNTYQRAVARMVSNNRHRLVLDVATHLEDLIRGIPGGTVELLEHFGPADWRKAAKAAGHPATKPPSAETREAVVEKVRRDLAEPYRAKGRR